MYRHLLEIFLHEARQSLADESLPLPDPFLDLSFSHLLRVLPVGLQQLQHEGVLQDLLAQLAGQKLTVRDETVQEAQVGLAQVEGLHLVHEAGCKVETDERVLFGWRSKLEPWGDDLKEGTIVHRP